MTTRVNREGGVHVGRVLFEGDPCFGWRVCELTARELGDWFVRVEGVWEGEGFARSQGRELWVGVWRLLLGVVTDVLGGFDWSTRMGRDGACWSYKQGEGIRGMIWGKL